MRIKGIKENHISFSEFCFRYGHSKCFAKYNHDGKVHEHQYSCHAVKLADLNKALEKYQNYLKRPVPPKSNKCKSCGQEMN